MAVEERHDPLDPARDRLLVSTIVPAMNEEGNIGEFCRLYADMLKTAPFEGELVFVDDGSTDGTVEKIRQAAQQYSFIKYASHQRNRGLTEALETGFSIASGEVFVFYPADLQYLPEDIPVLVSRSPRGPTCAPVGSRGSIRRSLSPMCTIGFRAGYSISRCTISIP